MMTTLTLGNGTVTSYCYYGTVGTNDTTGGYYGRLWNIATAKSGTTVQEATHAWDAGGNLTQRINYLSGSDTQTEDFSYDFLDRLTAVSGAYSNSYAYNQIGNITSFNGASYSYGTKPHAVTQAGGSVYAYDNNGNLTSDNTSRSRTLTWDAENRPVTITSGGVTTTFVYDGDGKRVRKTVGGVSTLYVNQFYEKTGDNVTTSYFFGGKLVAQRVNTALSYVHADHLGSTSVTTSSTGTVTGTLRYLPYGGTRSGSVSIDIRFTGQRTDDSTGLYFYNARYYDPELGRFVSPDTVVPVFGNPQSLNRFSYCLNNPLRYVDPSGNVEGAPVSYFNLMYGDEYGYRTEDNEVTFVALGNQMTAEDKDQVKAYTDLLDSKGKTWIALPDNNPKSLDFNGRTEQIRNATGLFARDSKLNYLGYSEGAAGIESYLNDVKGDSQIADRVRNVFLLERPCGLGNANLSKLFSDFPSINARDIWNTASPVHAPVSGGYQYGHSYPSDTAGGSGAKYAAAAALGVSIGSIGGGLLAKDTIMAEHGEPLRADSRALAYFKENWRF
jgi:RHS repeat-associated protein